MEDDFVVPEDEEENMYSITVQSKKKERQEKPPAINMSNFM